MDLSNLKSYLMLNLGEKTAEEYTNQLNSFFKQYAEMTQDNLNTYLTSKLNKWGAGSFNMFFKAMRWYQKFYKTTYELPDFKKEERKPRAYLQESEINDIITKSEIIFNDYQKVSIIFTLMFISGIRPKELYTLKRSDINLTNGKITLTNTKTSTSRVVFIAQDLTKKIELFFNYEAEQDNAFNLHENTLSYYCATISKHLNIKLTPYTCRHTFAHSFLKRSGNNLIALSKILGHTSIKTTAIYSDVGEKELHDIYNKAFKGR